MPTFKSKYWCPNISQVNAFRVTWENENNYLVSTTHLVSSNKIKVSWNSDSTTLAIGIFLTIPSKPVYKYFPRLRYRFIKKETLPQVFSCEFCKIYKNTFSYTTPPVAASEYVTTYTKQVTIHKLRGFSPWFLKLFTVLWTFHKNFIQSSEADVYQKTICNTIGLRLILSNK